MGQIFLKCGKNSELFFWGTCVHFQFRVIAKLRKITVTTVGLAHAQIRFQFQIRLRLVGLVMDGAVGLVRLVILDDLHQLYHPSGPVIERILPPLTSPHQSYF